MKKQLILITFLCAGIFAFADSDAAQLNSEMISAYNGGFYPGVVRCADKILQENASSPFAGAAFIYKGESLFRMGRVQEAVLVLDKARKAAGDDEELSSKRLYWIGRCFERLGNDKEALIYLHEAAKLSKKQTAQKGSVYPQSVYYSGLTLNRLGEHEKAADVFNFVLNNGRLYSQSQYELASVLFVESCNSSAQFDRGIKIADSLKDTQFSDFTKFNLMLGQGDALSGKGRYKDAYKKYCTVLESAPAELAVVAMQKAYTVSAEHRNEVNEDPGSVIEKAGPRLASYPELVSSFWTRLAIDAFNRKDYKKSVEYFDNVNSDDTKLEQIAVLYRTEIEFINKSKNEEAAAKSAADTLIQQKEKFGQDNASYELFLARYYGLGQNYEECRKLSSKYLNHTDEPLKKTAIYWNAYSLYKQKRYSDGAKLLEGVNYGDDKGFAHLHARLLAQTGNLNRADKIFYALGEREQLGNQGHLDYARTLLTGGYLISTVEQASMAGGAEGHYLKGLAFFNRRNWEEAESAFYLSQNDKSLESPYRENALFYLGYSRYQLNKYDGALESLISFTRALPSSSLIWNACVTASRSAAQLGKYQVAADFAQKAITNSKNEDQKQESILLCAGVYSDSSAYDRAISTLRPYSGQKNAFGFQCKYLTAQILVQKGDYEGADKTYAELSSEKAALSLSEEALYRRGELSYTTGKYDKAVPLFAEYIKKYNHGEFYFASMYFTADCLAKTKQTDKAILYYRQIAQSPEKSTYKYGSHRQLINLYKQTGEYGLAIQSCQYLMEEYGEQASADGVSDAMRELKALDSGANTELVKMQKAWEEKGGLKTFEGRVAGTALAEYYLNTQNDSKKAESLAQSLLDKQKSIDAESAYAGKNALLLAGIYRNRFDNQKSASMYLVAAEQLRKAGDAEGAARSLYGAAESFDAGMMYADSKSTAQYLQKLYPDSPYSKRAASFIK